VSCRKQRDWGLAQDNLNTKGQRAKLFAGGVGKARTSTASGFVARPDAGLAKGWGLESDPPLPPPENSLVSGGICIQRCELQAWLGCSCPSCACKLALSKP